MNRLIMKIKHFIERIKYQSSVFNSRKRTYGLKVAVVSFYDGIFPPEKKKIYLKTISESVDKIMTRFNNEFNETMKENCFDERTNKRIIWICWWQGITSMPELVRMCYDQLNNIIDNEKFEIKLITLDNYQSFVDFPDYIIKKR